ncbi:MULTISPECIES: hypothetical protein [unclassified Brevibacterium]|uniref:hypothetical protein n=1 Tax=unclassified Brevibacterium TaxID=2614124 RepID=UPI001866C05C|nr:MULTISPECIES: hypothetical protein [unclassified Brevibacterium]
MSCTPKPIRRQNKILTAQVRKHQRRNPKALVVLLDESWTMFNGYGAAHVEKMMRESRRSDDHQSNRRAPSPIVQRLTDLPQGILDSLREQGNA